MLFHTKHYQLVLLDFVTKTKKAFFYHNIISFLILVMMTIIPFSNVIADSNEVDTKFFVFEPAKKIKANLGNKSQTRIDIHPHYIKEIIGDSSSYIAVHDSKGRFLYLLPKASVGEKITLSILTSSGKAQDFEFEVTEEEGSVVVVSSIPNNHNALDSTDAELKSLLTAMIAGIKSKYYVQDFTGKSKTSNCITCSSSVSKRKKYIKGINLAEFNLNDLSLESDSLKNLAKIFEIRGQKIYSYDLFGLHGIVLEVKNLSKKKQIIEEQIFAKIFTGSVLVSLAKKELAPKMSSKVFVIIKPSKILALGGRDA